MVEKVTKILIIRCGSRSLELIENLIRGCPDVYHVVCAVPEYTQDRSTRREAPAEQAATTAIPPPSSFPDIEKNGKA